MELREPDEIREAVKSLKLAWTRYNDMHQCYIQRNDNYGKIMRITLDVLKQSMISSPS